MRKLRADALEGPSGRLLVPLNLGVVGALMTGRKIARRSPGVLGVAVRLPADRVDIAHAGHSTAAGADSNRAPATAPAEPTGPRPGAAVESVPRPALRRGPTRHGQRTEASAKRAPALDTVHAKRAK